MESMSFRRPHRPGFAGRTYLLSFRMRIRVEPPTLKSASEVLCMTDNGPEDEYFELVHDPHEMLPGFWGSQLERVKHGAENRTSQRMECNGKIRPFRAAERRTAISIRPA